MIGEEAWAQFPKIRDGGFNSQLVARAPGIAMFLRVLGQVCGARELSSVHGSTLSRLGSRGLLPLNALPALGAFPFFPALGPSIRLRCGAPFASQALPFAEPARSPGFWVSPAAPSGSRCGLSLLPHGRRASAANVVETAATRRWLFRAAGFPLFAGSTGLTRKLSS